MYIIPLLMQSCCLYVFMCTGFLCMKTYRLLCLWLRRFFQLPIFTLRFYCYCYVPADFALDTTLTLNQTGRQIGELELQNSDFNNFANFAHDCSSVFPPKSGPSSLSGSIVTVMYLLILLWIQPSHSTKPADK